MTYPNKANITGDQNTPLPIEMAYFIEDSEPDNTKSNRYYFNFPAEYTLKKIKFHFVNTS